jgi:endoglucanase
MTTRKNASRLNALIVAITGFLMFPMLAQAQLPATTYGWNLGNTMEPSCGEGCWAAPATQALINSVAANGFNTIRIPVSWDSHANPRTMVIDPAWLARVKQVVDWSRAAGLTVIINNHWDNGWFDGSGFRRFDSKVNKKMQSYWTQIANTFQGYDSRLLFCAANEPAADTQAKTNVLLQYYQTFVNAVRATGGTNATRWLILPGPNTNIDHTFNFMNTLPTDPTPGRLVIDVHYYDPYNFTLMPADESWGNMSYFWGQGYHSVTMPTRNSTWGEEQWLNDQFEKMRTKFVDKGVPVLVGEFGAMKRIEYADLSGTELQRHLASRTYFNKQIVDTANLKGLKPVYWDNGWNGKDGFQLFDHATGAVTDADGVRSLTGGVALTPP